MIPAVLVPILIQIGSRLVDLAFDYIEKMPPEKATKVLNKVEVNQKKKDEKKAAKEEHDVQW